MEQEKINKILELHSKWLRNDIGGVRADLSGRDLSGRDLSGRDLARANLAGANLTGLDLSGRDLSGADFSGTNMTRVNLFRANLSGTNITGAFLFSANGNNNEIKTIQTGSWIINYTDNVMQIGCEKHTIEEWMNFDDEKISSMSCGALEFWGKWKPILKLIIERDEK